jgi:hypothetical protein
VVGQNRKLREDDRYTFRQEKAKDARRRHSEGLKNLGRKERENENTDSEENS